MTFARLSNPDNHAIAVFGHGPEYAIVVGNVREGDVPDVVEILRDRALDFFGPAAIKSEGSSKSQNRDQLGNYRWDCHIEVTASQDTVLEFCQRVLKGSANQIC